MNEDIVFTYDPDEGFIPPKKSYFLRFKEWLIQIKSIIFVKKREKVQSFHYFQLNDFSK